MALTEKSSVKLNSAFCSLYLCVVCSFPLMLTCNEVEILKRRTKILVLIPVPLLRSPLPPNLKNLRFEQVWITKLNKVFSLRCSELSIELPVLSKNLEGYRGAVYRNGYPLGIRRFFQSWGRCYKNQNTDSIQIRAPKFRSCILKYRSICRFWNSDAKMWISEVRWGFCALLEFHPVQIRSIEV